jgi:hypothetical protein
MLFPRILATLVAIVALAAGVAAQPCVPTQCELKGNAFPRNANNCGILAETLSCTVNVYSECVVTGTVLWITQNIPCCTNSGPWNDQGSPNGSYVDWWNGSRTWLTNCSGEIVSVPSGVPACPSLLIVDARIKDCSGVVYSCGGVDYDAKKEWECE